MLVFISDLHLTDNTTSKTINRGAFEVFADDLQWMVQRACSRASEGSGPRFKALERVDLVLLGDIFDLLRSSRWHTDNAHDVRPWTPETVAPGERDGAHAQLAAMIDSITAEAIHCNGGAPEHRGTGISRLRDLVRDDIRVRGPDSREHRVPLKIWYMAGNHDWPLHVDHPAYDCARQRIIEAFGLAHPDASAFPHTCVDTCDELHAVLESHKTLAQHGDLYDPNNFPFDISDEVEEPEHGARAHASLGDAIVIEILNGLPSEIMKAIDPDDPIQSNPGFRRALDELDNVRPYFAMPQWLASVLGRYETGARNKASIEHRRRHAIREALDQTLRRFVDDPFVKRFDKPWHLDTVDALQAGVALNRLLSIETLSQVSLRHERQDRPTSYREHAERELHARGRQRDVEFIVFGHTHYPEVVPLDLDFPRGYVYLNTGTWRRVHRRCVAERRQFEFLDHHVMSMVAIYQGDEREGRPYETWSGTLGVRPEA